MAAPTTLRLRKLWLTLHRWIGVLLALLIIPVSLSGSALVWHDWLDMAVNPERQVSAPAALPTSAYLATARAALPGEARISRLTWPKGGEGPVVVSASTPPPRQGARPGRISLYLHPADARAIDRQTGNEGAVRFLHVLHGSLFVPEVGRQIVGWIGVAMLLSSLTGLWLWWPTKGGLRSGLRWRRGAAASTSSSLHHQAGFWIALPLAVLSLTGAWISFPAFFGKLSGEGGGGGRPPAARPLAETGTSVDAALRAALAAAPGQPISVALPTDRKPEWIVEVARAGEPTEVVVADGTSVAEVQAPEPESVARLMRRIHDGTGTGPVWQTIIFVGGILPAVLAVTGIVMWARGRRRRTASRARRGGGRVAALPAE